ncbi:hypothetical protein [Lentzea flaviverrucosa]|uniref:Uncharacterized protein n=1 Tax=Lentzea flaviverrucosa TaxID=200379 RepID=A0A1H9XWB0_9PSEU|nr:hypothetical protein [Lentzea flaviverrucosa]RDI34379.1 hypothetical protein DFR72_101126 [Lentzea flaviverrucosa]SES50450.1 hypothetical protein SAMN05216195_12081 [Lentzea flaviverrucosa]
MSLDEAAEAALRERWSRSQRHITMFSVVLPALQLPLCTVIVVMAGGGSTWPTAVPLVPVAVAAVALRQWVRRQAPLDPLKWRSAALLAVGVQLLSVAVPAYDIATGHTPDALTGPAILIFLSCVVAAATCVSAHRAGRALLTPLVAELGSADLRLTLPVRAAATGPELVSARIVVERDRVEWTVRLHVRRRGDPRIDVSVPFRELLQVMPVTLPGVPELRPWTVLPGGITLHAQAGPAILVTSTQDQWLLPVHDADLVAELILRRQTLWLQGSP